MSNENTVEGGPVRRLVGRTYVRQWNPHPYGYGEICATCGYHGKTTIGRVVHQRRGCLPNAQDHRAGEVEP
jgi:hypothetical protein